MKFGFIGPTYQNQSIAVDGERCINLYPEIVPGEGKSRVVLYGTPGLELWATLPQSPGQGIFVEETTARAFAVSGARLYELFADKTFQDLGVTSDSGVASFASNGTQVIIVFSVSGRGFIFDLVSGVLSEINRDTQPGFTGAQTVSFMDGYFILPRIGSRQFNISALYDGRKWDGLDNAKKEGEADVLASHVVNQRELWLFGTKSTEVWWDSGNPNFPFTPIQGSLIEQGCAATLSPAVLSTGVHWISSDKRGNAIVVRANAFTPQRISNHSIENFLQGYSTVADAIGWGYQENGHEFYMLHLPTAKATWAFDSSTGMWHERGYWNLGTGEYGPSLGRYHAFAFNKHLVLDYSSGKVYRQSIRIYTDNGNPIRRLRSSPHLSDEMTWTRFSQFQLDMQVGVVPETGQGKAPVVMLQLSNDGGFTWGNELHSQSFMTGQYRARVIWRRLGRARDRAFRVAFTDPIEVAFIEGLLKARPGTGV